MRSGKTNSYEYIYVIHGNDIEKIENIKNTTMQLKFNLTFHSKKVKFVYVRHLLEEDVLRWPEPRNTGFRVKWIQTPIENSSIFSQIKKYRKYSSNHQFRQLTNIFSFALQSNYKVEDIWDFLFSTKVDLMQKDKNVSIFSVFLQKKQHLIRYRVSKKK